MGGPCRCQILCAEEKTVCCARPAPVSICYLRGCSQNRLGNAFNIGATYCLPRKGIPAVDYPSIGIGSDGFLLLDWTKFWLCSRSICRLNTSNATLVQSSHNNLNFVANPSLEANNCKKGLNAKPVSTSDRSYTFYYCQSYRRAQSLCIREKNISWSFF